MKTGISNQSEYLPLLESLGIYDAFELDTLENIIERYAPRNTCTFTLFEV
jgi:hypothetical protein